MGPINRRAAVPLRLTSTLEFRNEVRAGLRLSSRESERMKIVHIRAVRSGAYSLWACWTYFV
uniref:Uncharacterized protein n=1 Tax=Cannabis sativa TaxID=3483 RepID=A0A803R0H4_CANSA